MTSIEQLVLKNNELLKNALEKAIAEKLEVEERYLSEAREWQAERMEYIEIIDRLKQMVEMLK